VPELQTIVLFLITVIVSTVYILGKFVDHQEASLKTNNYDSYSKPKINSYQQTELVRQESLKIVEQELRDRKIVNQTIKQVMALQNRNRLEEMEVYDIKTGQKIKYYKENS
jgi:hypothetical protein